MPKSPKKYFFLFATATLFLFLPFFTNAFVDAALSPALSSYESKVVDLINAERKKAGVSTSLKLNEKLITAARGHNGTMTKCAKSYGVDPCFSHQVTKLGEAKLMDRVNQTGYNASSVAENIAWGYKTPEGAVKGWMNSSGHKAAILNTSRPDIGCAYDATYNFWTCDFGKSFDTQPVLATPKPSATATAKASSSPSPSSTETPRRSGSKTPTATPKASATASPMPTETTQLPWWCKYAPQSFFCKSS